jgi:hypothetical protein
MFIYFSFYDLSIDMVLIWFSLSSNKAIFLGSFEIKSPYSPYMAL